MNPMGILVLGVAGGILLESPIKRQKVMIAISSITKQAGAIAKEIVPTGGEVVEQTEVSTEYK